MKIRSTYPFIAIAIIIMITALTPSTHAQRRVTPVNNAATATQPVNENKLPGDSIDRSKLVKYRDDKGNIVLVDTISGREFVDSTDMPVVPPMLYPLVFDASVGINLWDPLMRAFGQSYGLIGFSAHFNMHNRYIAALEFGLGNANNTPADNNFTYRSPLAPYFKIGMDYNFLYNSNPDYMIYAGMRYGFTPFKWTLDDVSLNPGYWDGPTSMQFPDIKTTAGYLELLLGIKVKIAGPISMGWTFRYHKVIHQSATQYGKPWYIPGYGTRGSSIGASLSVYYTIPLKGRRQAIRDANLHYHPMEPPVGIEEETDNNTEATQEE